MNIRDWQARNRRAAFAAVKPAQIRALARKVIGDLEAKEQAKGYLNRDERRMVRRLREYLAKHEATAAPHSKKEPTPEAAP